METKAVEGARSIIPPPEEADLASSSSATFPDLAIEEVPLYLIYGDCAVEY